VPKTTPILDAARPDALRLIMSDGLGEYLEFGGLSEHRPLRDV